MHETSGWSKERTGGERTEESPSVRIDAFGLTDPGKVRQFNQDQFLIADLTKKLDVRQTSLREEAAERFSNIHSRVLLVADGMGGHAAGGEASTLAVETIRSYLVYTMPWILSQRPGREGATDEELKRALEKCHADVLAAGKGRPEREGMGTTMTLAYVMWPNLYLVHVGDSRCYLLRGDLIERITRDHTYAQKLIEEGGLTPDQAEDSFLSNVLTRVIGGDSKSVEVDAYQARLEVGDALLLSSDGLNKHVSEKAIFEILHRTDRAEAGCRELVAAALDGGGTDNVTVVVARFVEVPSP
jgi:protein phosphatase